MTVEEKVKDKLKEMFPEYKGFIEHTLVSSMCLSYHKEASKELLEVLENFIKAVKNEEKGNDFIADVVSSNLKLLWWGWSTFWGIFMIGFAIFRYCL